MNYPDKDTRQVIAGVASQIIKDNKRRNPRYRPGGDWWYYFQEGCEAYEIYGFVLYEDDLKEYIYENIEEPDFDDLSDF